MNRTQKNAWFGLANCLLAICFYFFPIYRSAFSIVVPAFKFDPQPSQTEIVVKIILQHLPAAFLVIALLLLLVPRKKQSPAEPDFDELDAAIQNKAIRAGFISVWLLWPLAIILIILKYGINEMLSAIEYLYIHVGVFIICMAIYFLTKVLLYKKQTEGGIA